MRRKIALVLFAITVTSSLFLTLPAKVSAFTSPTIENITPRDQPKTVCMQASGGIEELCATGMFYVIAEAGAKLLSPSSLTARDSFNVAAALNRGDMVAAQAILNQGGNPGLGSFLFEANYAMLEQRPASGILFAVDQIDKAITPESVYAQDPAPYFPGTGFTLMTPIQSFWGWSVTISYSFMILIIVGVAFALMFRSQLDGTTVVQLQNAIPGIVAAMILIPLSYPISGLFIDAITLSTNVYHDFIFGPSGPGRDVYTNGTEQFGDERPAYNDPDTRGLYVDDWRLNVFRFYERIGINQLGSVAAVNLCPDDANEQISESVCSISNSGVLSFVNGILNFFFGRDGETGAQVVLGTVLNLLFSLVAIVVSFRIAKRLLIKLVILMFMPIAAPFIFATIAIPGQGTKNLISYLKGMAAASLFFIVTYIIFTTTLVLTNEAFFSSIPNINTYEFRPPLLGDLGAFVTNTVDSGVGSGLGASGFLFSIVGAFLFLSIPKILDTINEKLDVPPDFIPQALKPYIEDIKYSGDYALRKVPTAAQAGGVALAAGTYRNTIGAIGKRIGSSRDNPFASSYGSQAVDRMQAELAGLEQKALDAKDPVSKAYWQGRAAVARGRMNTYSQFLGQGAALTPPKGEKGVKFSIKAEFPEVEYGTVRESTIRGIIAKGGTNGTITIGVDDDATAPRGTILFAVIAERAEGAVVSELKWDGDRGTSAVIVIPKGSYSISSGIATITDPEKSFQGAKKQTINAKLIFPATTPTTHYNGVWATAGMATRIRVIVGDSAPVPLSFYRVVVQR